MEMEPDRRDLCQFKGRRQNDGVKLKKVKEFEYLGSTEQVYLCLMPVQSNGE